MDSATLQRRKLGAGKAEMLPGAFRTREARSPLPYKQDMGLLKTCTTRKAGMTCDQLRSASLLQGKEGPCPAALFPSPKLGTSYTDPQSPPLPGIAQPVAHFFFLTTHPGFAYAMALPSQPFVPRQGGNWLFCHRNLFLSCPGSMAMGRAGAGTHLCRHGYKLRLPGGRWLPLLGAGLVSR